MSIIPNLDTMTDEEKLAALERNHHRLGIP